MTALPKSSQAQPVSRLEEAFHLHTGIMAPEHHNLHLRKQISKDYIFKKSFTDYFFSREFLLVYTT